ncbi:hypothetical protein J5H46_22640, partial [Enterobacter sichuanensis]|uniref:hypothetical protein n=1 Tax=Enterobacter sichuanensis TaxID=2071710 RepID=UPI001AAE9967
MSTAINESHNLTWFDGRLHGVTFHPAALNAVTKVINVVRSEQHLRRFNRLINCDGILHFHFLRVSLS